MITVVGSLNMDLVAYTDRIPRPGETVMGKDFRQIPGGKGGNQASAAAKLGASVRMVGCVGTDSFGTQLRESLQQDGVNVDYVMARPQEATGVAVILVERGGDNSITVAPGANYSILPADIDKMEAVIADSHVLLLQLEIPLETVKATILKGKSQGKLVILNPAPATLLEEELLDHVDILTPNETELEILSGHKTDTLENLKKAGRILLGKGVKDLVITLGSRGALHINKDTEEHYDGYKVRVVDTTAAGDSFNGALAVALSQGKTMAEAIGFAMKVGAMTVTKEGAQPSLPLLHEVNDFHQWLKEQNILQGGKPE